MATPNNYQFSRLMPQAVELEESILGAIMLEREAPGTALNLMEHQMFYKEAHQKIFAAFERMYKDGEPIDILTVTNHLRDRKTQEIPGSFGVYATELDAIGGAFYISQLTSRVASAANLEFHCYIVIQKWMQRKVIEVGGTAITRCYNDDRDIQDVFDSIGDLLLIRDKLVKRGAEIQKLGDYIDMEVENYNARADAHQTGRTFGVPSGLRSLDSVTNGWTPGELVIVAARPAMGKSALAELFAQTPAERQMPVGVVSLEMPSVQWASRTVVAMAEVDSMMYKKGALESKDVEKLNVARSRLKDLPLYIDETPAQKITGVRAKARRLKQRHDIQLLIVDYLQLMDGKEKNGSSGRVEEVSAISRGLKALAKELHIPVIALAQLSRAVETRGGDKRPQLSDLRDSGSIEQDADMVIFIHRPEYYGFTQTAEGNSTAELAELIIAKYRDGATGQVDVRFIGRFAKFVDFGAYHQQPIQPNVNFQHESKKNEDPF